MEYIDLKDNHKVLIFSDIHFHEYKPFSVPTSDGIGSRLKWLLYAFERIMDYAVKNNIEHVFFLGDLFHQRTLMYSIVFDRVAEAIKAAADQGIKLHLILGNHDYIHNSDNSPSVVKHIQSVDVIDTPTVYFIRNYNEKIACIPFRFTLDQLKEDLQTVQTEINDQPNTSNVEHLLFGHFELSGAAVNDEYVLKDSIDPGIFGDTLFKYVFSGHVHRKQTVILETSDKKFIEFVGHTLPHTFNDENNCYGFFVFDFSKPSDRYEFVPLKTISNFPEFVTIELHEQEDIKNFIKERRERFELDYHRIRSYSEELKLDNVFKRLGHYTAEYMGPITDRKIEGNEESVQFNLDIKYYLRLFIEQEQKVQSMEWMEDQDVFSYLDKVMTKGNICLR